MNIIDTSTSVRLDSIKNSEIRNIPLFDIKRLNHQLDHLDFENVIFQSKSSVDCFDHFKFISEKKIFAIGEGTALALKNKNISTLVPEKFGSKGLIDFIKRKKYGGNSLIIKGAKGLSIVRDELVNLGYKASEISCYEREKFISYSHLRADYDGADVIIFTSLFSAEIYFQELFTKNSRAIFLGISERICSCADKFDVKINQIDYFSKNLVKDIRNII